MSNLSRVEVSSVRTLGKLTKFVYPWMNRRKPYWVDQKSDPDINVDLSKENQEFLFTGRFEQFELKINPIKLTSNALRPWKPLETQRCGLIAFKIGIYPMWTNSGNKIDCTILQV